jgi:hypothetical protein
MAIYLMWPVSKHTVYLPEEPLQILKHLVGRRRKLKQGGAISTQKL